MNINQQQIIHNLIPAVLFAGALIGVLYILIAGTAIIGIFLQSCKTAFYVYEYILFLVPVLSLILAVAGQFLKFMKHIRHSQFIFRYYIINDFPGK